MQVGDATVSRGEPNDGEGAAPVFENASDIESERLLEDEIWPAKRTATKQPKLGKVRVGSLASRVVNRIDYNVYANQMRPLERSKPRLDR